MFESKREKKSSFERIYIYIYIFVERYGILTLCTSRYILPYRGTNDVFP